MLSTVIDFKTRNPGDNCGPPPPPPPRPPPPFQSRQEEEDLKNTLKGLSYLQPVYEKIDKEEKNIEAQKKKKEEERRTERARAEQWEGTKRSCSEYLNAICRLLPYLVRVGRGA